MMLAALLPLARGSLRLRLLAACLVLLCVRPAASLRRSQAGTARREPIQPLSGAVYTLEELEGDSSSYFEEQRRSERLDPLNPVRAGSVSFNSNPGDPAAWATFQKKSETLLTHVGRGVKLNFSEVGGSCNGFIRPFSDFDTMQGHGHPWCRYEPSLDELARYKADPMDLAILIPHNKLTTLIAAAGRDQLWYDPEESARSWRAYAKFHGYAFYQGVVPGPEPCYKQVESLTKEQGGGRAPEWLKPCMALQLMRKHKYLLVVDGDTFVTKPGLRMEPLFAKVGLLQEPSTKSIAVAKEWGSCRTGRQLHSSGLLNTGVMLLKHTAEEAIRTWVYNDGCKGDCTGYRRSMTKWAFDQFGFAATAATLFADQITVLPSGCPINGPWGDFISHLVGGSFSKSFYDPTRRGQIITAARQCMESVFKRPAGKEYHRCSLCDLVDFDQGGGSGFDISCASRF